MTKVIIDIEKLKEEVNDYKCKHPIYAEQKKANEMIDLFINIIDSYADEGEEIKTGEWIATQVIGISNITLTCSNCKDEFIGENDIDTWKSVYHYCPSCGAYMGGI